jgi:hypothetical protein
MKLKHKHLAYFTVILLFTFIAISICVFSYFTLEEIQKSSKVSLAGIVRDKLGAPIMDASVTVDNKMIKTDYTGSFIISDLTWGWNDLKVEADSYRSYEYQTYLPFGTKTFYSAVLESENHAIITGFITSNDNQIFEKNRQSIIFKINSSNVQIKNDNTFVTDKIGIQKVSILIQVPEFEEYFKIVELKSGINDIGTIKIVKKTTNRSIGLKDNNDLPISNSSVIFNGIVIKTDREGFLSLSDAQLENGELIKIQANGFKEKNLIYNATLLDTIITLDQD